MWPGDPPRFTHLEIFVVQTHDLAEQGIKVEHVRAQ